MVFDELDPEGPAPEDLADDSAETIRCPRCGESVYEDADRCNHCGGWFTRRTSARPWWWLAVVATAVATMLWFTLRR